jgi:DNA-binding CsgD family transcriptional regulator
MAMIIDNSMDMETDPKSFNVIHWEESDLTNTALEPLFQLFGDQNRLTAREREVMRTLMLLGLRNDDLSSMLYISPKTVKHHLASMMDKTGTRSSRDLQAMFLRFVLLGVKTQV